MTPTTTRLVFVSVVTFGLSIAGFLLALFAQWPSQFILGGAADSAVTVADLVTGTATSAPLVPLVLLGGAAVLARSPRGWGTTAVVVLCVLGGVFIVGGMGEVLAPPTPHVSRSVLISAGVAAGALGGALLVSGVIDLADRVRRSRSKSRASGAVEGLPTAGR